MKNEELRLQYEEIELKHIQLELKNGRSQHMRHFVDQYFCYNKGYVNNKIKAKWDLIFWKEWVSLKAEKISDKKLVVKEHVVPLKVITEKLNKLNQDCTIKEIKDVLDKYLHFATITKSEDKKLNSSGFKQKMPKEFDDLKHDLHDDIFARYKVVGIEYKKV